MKAMVLAAGRGERMRPLTDELPKPLLSVNDKPLIAYHLEKLAAAGVTDVVINHAWLGEKIERMLGDGSQWGVSVTYSPEPKGGLETAGGIIKALRALGSEPFWVINGDVWTTIDFNRLPRHLCRDDMAHLILVNNPAHNKAGDFGIENGRLRAKSAGNDSYTYAGIGLFRPQWFSDLPAEKLALRPLFEQAIATDSLAATLLTDCDWFDIGTPQRLAALDSKLRGANDLG